MSRKRNSKRNNGIRNKRVRRERGSWRDALGLQPGHYLPLHPALTDIECPDCGASWSAPQRQRRADAGVLDHAATCPIGKGYADAAEDDRLWFAAHPRATQRVRPPSMAELQAVMLSTGQALPDMPHGGRYEPGGEVVVTKLSARLRQRDFTGAVMWAQPVLSPPNEVEGAYDADEYDEYGVRWFREHLSPTDEGQWL